MKEKSKSWQNILTPQYDKKIWHDIEFPAYGKEGWAIQTKNKVRYYDNIDDLYPIVGAWPVQKPILVGMPGASRFVLPICVHEFQKILFPSIKRHYTFLIGFLLAFSVFPLLASTIVKPLKYFTMFIGAISLAALFFCDYYLYLRTNDGFRERSEFLYWLYTDKDVKQGFFFWIFFILLFHGCHGCSHKLDPEQMENSAGLHLCKHPWSVCTDGMVRMYL